MGRSERRYGKPDGKPAGFPPLRHPDPWAWELDHDIPVAERPDQALVVSNFRASHAICNRRRGGPPEMEPDTGCPSEDWNSIP